MSAVLASPRVRRVLLLGWLVPVCAVAPESLAVPSMADLDLSGSAIAAVTGLAVVALLAPGIAGRPQPGNSASEAALL
jgi:hypothetical protein